MRLPKRDVRSLAVYSLIFNLIYAFYNGTLGIISSSLWFGASCFYYLFLAVMRFVIIVGTKRGDMKREKGLVLATGIMMSLLSPVLSAILIISLIYPVPSKYGTVVMITVATYTFTKIALAIKRAVKHRGERSRVASALRAVGYAEVAVSLLSMQRSMIVSFDGMPKENELMLNAFTGGAVCLLVLMLGIITVKKSKKENKNGKI